MPSSTHWSVNLTRAWLSRGWLATLLWPLSLVYGALMTARTWCYRCGLFPVTRFTVPVVVVGNVVVGGAGKTPVTVSVVQHLVRCGHRPGVISRGHGRQASEGNPVALAVHHHSDAALVGDEPLLIHQATGVPVFVARRRADAAKALLAAHPGTTVIVCDDGLQHLALHADVSIAVFDERGTGNGWLLPAGLLRERWPHGTGRPVDLVLQATPAAELAAPAHKLAHTHTHTGNATGPRVYQAQKALATHAYNPTGHRVPLADLTATAGTAMAGIAKPDAFFDMLRARGVRLSHTWSLQDHHTPDANFYSKLFNKLERENVFLTEKDAVKLFPAWSDRHVNAHRTEAKAPSLTSDAGRPYDLWAVPLTLHIEPAFFAALDAKLSSRHGHQTA